MAGWLRVALSSLLVTEAVVNPERACDSAIGSAGCSGLEESSFLQFQSLAHNADSSLSAANSMGRMKLSMRAVNKRHSQLPHVSINFSRVTGITYVVDVKVNGVVLPVQIDTGSATFAVVGAGALVPGTSECTKPAKQTCWDSIPVVDKYVTGNWSGVTCRGDVEMGGVSVSGALYVSISEAYGMGYACDHMGIAGFGFNSAITGGVTLLQWLVSGNPHLLPVFGIQACPLGSKQDGAFTLGYSDTAHYSGELTQLKVTSMAQGYWCVHMTSLSLIFPNKTTVSFMLDFVSTFLKCDTIIDSGNAKGFTFIPSILDQLMPVMSTFYKEDLGVDSVMKCVSQEDLAAFPVLSIGLMTMDDEAHYVNFEPSSWVVSPNATCYMPFVSPTPINTNNNLGQSLLESYYAYFSSPTSTMLPYVALAPIAGCN